jgi:hypothetical protein
MTRRAGQAGLRTGRCAPKCWRGCCAALLTWRQVRRERSPYPGPRGWAAGVSGATFKHRLRLNGCYVPDGIDLSEATTWTLDLRGWHVGAMHLGSARIDGALNLRGGICMARAAPP